MRQFSHKIGRILRWKPTFSKGAATYSNMRLLVKEKVTVKVQLQFFDRLPKRIDRF